MPKKIAIIGTVGLPANYGGFETLTAFLTTHLANRFDMTVYCSSKSYTNKLPEYNKSRLKYIPLQANGIQSILYDIVSMISALRFADTLLVLGVSGCIILPFIKLISRKTIIVNIDGQEWKRAKWGRAAKWFLKYSEKLAVTYADTVIADNKVIQDYVWETYKVKSELIAYGGDHTSKVKLTDEMLSQFPFLNEPYAFKVCRIEPENNVHLIIETFASHAKLNLVIVGNWSNSDYGTQLKLQYESVSNIRLLDPIYDQHRLDQIRSNCSVYVHGHSAGGTNPSLVEAMYLALPILAFGVNYNRETTVNSALYFNSKTELQSLLSSIKPDDLQSMSIKLKAIADLRYNWETISEQYAVLF